MSLFFFFNDTATTEIYTLSLHDALPICAPGSGRGRRTRLGLRDADRRQRHLDRKSTRLNSSYVEISYAVFCLKKKKKKNIYTNFDIQNRHLLQFTSLQTTTPIAPINNLA